MVSGHLYFLLTDQSSGRVFVLLRCSGLGGFQAAVTTALLCRTLLMYVQRKERVFFNPGKYQPQKLWHCCFVGDTWPERARTEQETLQALLSGVGL